MSADELLAMQGAARAALTAGDPTHPDPALQMQLGLSEYMLSLHVRGENTLANAKKLGYLDARELYPDVRAKGLEEFAREMYALEEPGAIHLKH